MYRWIELFSRHSLPASPITDFRCQKGGEFLSVVTFSFDGIRETDMDKIYLQGGWMTAAKLTGE